MRFLTAAACAMALVSWAARDLSANGQEFFPANEGPVHLVYFGIIKDARTGRPVRDNAYLTIQDSLTGTNIPFTGDRPGHFRSPDVGLVIKELGEVPDPARLSMTLLVPGYRKVDVTRMPRRANGAVNLSVRLQPDDGRAPASLKTRSDVTPDGTSNGDAASGARVSLAGSRDGLPTYTLAMWVFAAIVVASAIAGAVRSRAPRATTAR